MKIGSRIINPAHVIQARIISDFYVNGSRHQLEVTMADGSTLREEHGFGFDAFAALDILNEAVSGAVSGAGRNDGRRK